MHSSSRLSLKTNNSQSPKSSVMSVLSRRKTMNLKAYESNRDRRFRRRIRRLGESTTASEPVSQINATPIIRSRYMYFFVFLLFLSMTGLVLNSEESRRSAVKEFLSMYRHNFNELVYGKDKCIPKISTHLMFRDIRDEQILNQNHALQLLEIALRNTNNSRVNAIALVGTSGVGKTMTTRALQKHFPWPQNVYTYLWNTCVKEESEKFNMIRIFIEKLSLCGINLLIIDNLSPCEHEIVPIINNLLNDIVQQEGNEKHVIIIYVFNLSTLDESSVFDKKQEMVQKLPNTVTINFDQFGSKQLLDCINREAKFRNISLSDDNIMEIGKIINVTHSGCKNVPAKVTTHA